MATAVQGVQKDASKKTQKEPDFYIYRLKKANRKLTPNTPPFPPSYTLPNTSIIAYDPEKDTWSEQGKRKKAGATKICYLQGVDTIFASEQKDIPREVYRNPNNIIKFTHGEIRVPAYEKTLIQFLDWMSLNGDSPMRRDDAKIEFIKVDERKDKEREIEMMKKRKEAFDIAFNCSDEDMLPHAEFLNIPLKGNDGLDREMDVIRLDYQNAATGNPKRFLESVNNPKMRSFALVKKAIASSRIVFQNGVAMWGENKKVICTIPMDRDRVEYLVDFSYTDDGASFAAALKANV